MPTTHFYTIDATEAAAAIANMGATSEGQPFWACTGNRSKFVPMYRLVHPATGSYLFTTFIDEHDAAVNEEGYQGQGIGFWCLPPDASDTTGATQLYRGYNPKTDDHLYSLDWSETGYPYKREGVAGFVMTSQVAGSSPLYRFRSPTGLHFYTTQPNEDILGLNYIAEGTCGFVITSAQAVPQPFYRAYNPATGGHLYTLDFAEYDAASKNDGYRGDGIAFYIWPDGMQPAGALKLLRAYNGALDDHFYTTDPAEFAKALQHHVYANEGTAGWVLPPQMGIRFELLVAPVQRFFGDFVNDFFLLPDNLPASLSSNSNFILNSIVGAGIGPITGLEVDIEITADLTVSSVSSGDPGFSFQLNGLSPDFYASVWQQFCLFLDDGEIACEIQNWTQSPYAVGFIVGSANICNISGNTLKAGHRLSIKLISDDYANILGAEFSVYSGKKSLGHHQLLIKNFPNGVAQGAAPIVGFQVVLVGPGAGAQVNFAAGGAGLISYNAAVPLTAATQAPSNVEFVFTGMVETAETSNCTYGEIASTKSKTLAQTFGVTAQPFSLPTTVIPTRTLLRPPKPA